MAQPFILILVCLDYEKLFVFFVDQAQNEVFAF